jgi:hypothetical protein
VNYKGFVGECQARFRITPFSLWEKGWEEGMLMAAKPQSLTPCPSPSRRGELLLAIISNCFDRATSQRFLASYELGFIFRLLTDVGIGALERAGEVFWGSLAADITIDAGRINVEGAVRVLFNFIVWVRHESADYAD